MGTPLATSNTANTPAGVRLPEVGDSITFAVVDVDNDVPVYVYRSDRVPELNAKGDPKKQIRITALVVSVEGALIGPSEEPRTPEPGEIVSIYVSGYGKWDPDQDKTDSTHKSWSAVTDANGIGLEVGYVGQWKFLGLIDGSGTQPRKDRKFRLSKPKPDELAQALRCEELRLELAERTVLVPATESGPFDERPSAASITDDF